jgi:hypothetical protein
LSVAEDSSSNQLSDCTLALRDFSFNCPAIGLRPVALSSWFSSPKSLRCKSVDVGLQRAVDVTGVVALELKGGALGRKAARSLSGCRG